MTTTYPASERQVAFIETLLKDRAVDSGTRFDIEARLSEGTLDKNLASEFIGLLKGFPYANKTAKDVLPLGMYRTSDGTIYRVHESRTSGRHYAKRMEYDLFSDKPQFVYAQGAMAKLTIEDRMTIEQAKAWGMETGFCCVCGAFLTDAKSVANGIGPVCAKLF